MIVVDASAILEVLLQTPAAPRIEARLFAPGETLHAPHLLDLEVVHVLTRIWALRHNLTAYDAAYVALAETLQVTLVTCDTRLAASVGHRATIALV
jgi:predicted nucleic acid-binding protein